jgi:hypothetical protein
MREMKEDECGRSEYEGENFDNRDEIFCLKEVLKDHGCGWSYAAKSE